MFTKHADIPKDDAKVLSPQEHKDLDKVSQKDPPAPRPKPSK